MTYFGVLALFILPPLLILTVIVPRDLWRWLVRRTGRVNLLAYAALGVHVLIALLYTTPWDNYLVAQGVWWYDPQLVSGVTFGWVPLEEYLFFMLQTLMTGLWVLGVRRTIFNREHRALSRRSIRTWGSATIIILWLACGWIFLSGWDPGTYLALILLWALPPVLLQWLVGGDILVANWRMLLAAIAPPTAYLWLVDAITIRSGTWTIDPEQTTGFTLAGLPLEEMLFFLMTNLMIAFGISLMLSQQVHHRLRSWLERVGFFATGNAAWE